MSKIKDIIGHAFQKQELQRDLEADNVSHAYLFTGPPNLGKMSLAHWFGCQLLCQGVDEDQKEEQCHQYENLTHSDLLVLDQLWIEEECDDWDVIAKTSNIPQIHRSKAPKAKTDVISIDDIRSLQERLHETGIGKYRCCIIRGIERMQDAAANAFLKILEEPPQGLVFILTTQKMATLLPTIVSRARVLRFQRLSTRDLLPIVSGLEEEDAQFILRIAQGAPGIASALAADPDLLREHKQIHASAVSFWKSTSLRERLQLLKPLHTRGPESDRYMLHLALGLREMGSRYSHTKALSGLVRGYQTNAHRQLLAQNFAMQLS